MQSSFSGGPAFGDKSSDARFAHQSYIIKRKTLQMFGATLYLYGPNEELMMWGKRQAFKLRSELQFFADETQTLEILRAVPRTAMNISVAYDVFDSRTGQKVGALQRQGLTSVLLQDKWTILDAQDREIGLAQEDSALLGFLRRYARSLSLFFPQKFSLTLNAPPSGDFAPISSPSGAPAPLNTLPVGNLARHFNPFSTRMDIDFSPDTNGALDRRLGLALAMLLEAVEAKR